MRTLLVFTLWVRLALTSLEELFSQHAPFLIIRSDDSSGPQIFVSDSTALAARWCRAYRTNVDERESERLFLQRVSTGLDIYTGDQISSVKAVRGIFRLKLAQNITRLVLKLAHFLRARTLFPLSNGKRFLAVLKRTDAVFSISHYDSNICFSILSDTDVY